MHWRVLSSLVGTLLLVAGVAGFALVVAVPALPVTVSAPLAAVLSGEVISGSPESVTAAVAPAPELKDPTRLPITYLNIPSIDVATQVVPAPLVERDGASTWDVPKFVAGHADGSAGAGSTGNAILIGHVTSLTLGNVFEHLDGVHPGDPIRVSSGDRQFEYRVVDVADVSRTDVSVLEPTPGASITLITCTGLWLPTVWDYSQRLVVRADLVGTPEQH
jgi:LPXTG-site transpeptidase (sortase) family protein